jgi:hypothetical protein
MLSLKLNSGNLPHVVCSLAVDLPGSHVACVGVERMTIVYNLLPIGCGLDRQISTNRSSTDHLSIAQERRPLLSTRAGAARVCRHVGVIRVERLPAEGRQYRYHLSIQIDLLYAEKRVRVSARILTIHLVLVALLLGLLRIALTIWRILSLVLLLGIALRLSRILSITLRLGRIGRGLLVSVLRIALRLSRVVHGCGLLIISRLIILDVRWLACLRSIV